MGAEPQRREPEAKPTAPPVCPICAAPTRRLFMVEGYWVCGCVRCGHRLAEIVAVPDHVARVYDDAYFFGGGAGYRDYLSEERLLRAHGRRYAQLLRRFMPPGRVLDVGAAAGFVLEGLLEAGWQGAAIEPNPHMAERIRQRLGIPVYSEPLDAFAGGEPFDLVMMIQVIGHFVDVRRSLEAATRQTRSGGYWLIESWNRESRIARLLGRRWHEYSPPTVLHWFSPAGLEHLAAQFGLSGVAGGRPIKRLNAAHAKSLLAHKLRDSRARRLIATALRLVPDDLELRYPNEDLFWRLFRKA